MPTNKVYPVDLLGNELRQGDMVHMEMTEIKPLLAIVAVDPACVIHGADGPVPCTGKVKFGLFFELPYSPENPRFKKAVKICQPEGSEAAVKAALQ